MVFKKHIILCILGPLTVLSIFASFYRFVVLHDYFVSYEGDCDPEEHSCFVGCEDDECTQTYTYVLIEKNARALEQECGKDISNCAPAHSCADEDHSCTITYCGGDSRDICTTTTYDL